MKAVCEVSGEHFEIGALELEFCAANGLPLPVVSPVERLRHMLYFRNRMHLYHSTCAFSGKSIFSSVSPEAGVPVYEGEIWESDHWDGRDYGRPYDFTRPFFEQFHDLFVEVPRPNLGNQALTLENCDYTNGIAWAKNCYLLFSSHEVSDCYFSKAIYRCNDIVDSLLVYDSQFCYDCENVKTSYRLIGCKHSSGCRDSAFLFNCHSCSDCYGCVNLSHKQFHFFNEPLSQAEYKQKIAAIDLGSYAAYAHQTERFSAFSRTFPLKLHFGVNNEQVSGDFLNDSRNCYNSCFISKSEDVEHSVYLERAKNSILHVNFGSNSELTYNSISVGDNSYNIKFSSDCWKGIHDLEYCINLRSGSHDCFGCCSLKKQSFCILNKQYSKEEYFELLPRIKEHMRQRGEYGRFFPVRSSPNYYNRSDVEEFFPLSRESAVRRGFRWSDDATTETGATAVVPDHVRNFDDCLLNEVFCCEESGKLFRVTKPELVFYRTHNVPVPRRAPMERIRKRCREFFAVKPIRSRECSNCHAEIRSCYEGSVLCEFCFTSSVFG